MYQLLSSLILPSGIAYTFFGVGLLTLFSKRLRRFSWIFVAASGAITLFFSTGVVASLLLSPLEHSGSASPEELQDHSISQIVVLTGWAKDYPGVPFGRRLDSLAAHRVLAAMELHQRCQQCQMIVTGDPVTVRLMAETMVSLGLVEDTLVLEEASASTADSAANIKPLVQEQSFFLVTSAAHMPRSLAVFRTQGLHPVAVPTEYMTGEDWSLSDLWPSSSYLQASDAAIHEYIGILWYRLTGRIRE